MSKLLKNHHNFFKPPQYELCSPKMKAIFEIIKYMKIKILITPLEPLTDLSFRVFKCVIFGDGILNFFQKCRIFGIFDFFLKIRWHRGLYGWYKKLIGGLLFAFTSILVGGCTWKCLKTWYLPVPDKTFSIPPFSLDRRFHRIPAEFTLSPSVKWWGVYFLLLHRFW